MTDAGFTPGPWDFDGEPSDSEAAIELGLDGYEIFQRDKSGDVADPIGTALEEADARLIAAAPDLHAACAKLANAWFEDTGGAFRLSELNDALAMARAALSKATVKPGGAP